MWLVLNCTGTGPWAGKEFTKTEEKRNQIRTLPVLDLLTSNKATWTGGKQLLIFTVIKFLSTHRKKYDPYNRLYNITGL